MRRTDRINHVLEIRLRILIFDLSHFRKRWEQTVVGPKMVPESNGIRNHWIDLIDGIDQNGCFVRPGTGDIARRVTPATEHKKRNAKCLCVLDTRTVAGDIQVEASQSVAAQTIGPALQDNRSRLVGLYTRTNNVFEELNVGFIFDPVVERDVDGMMGAGIERVGRPGTVECAGPWEKVVLIVFVKGYSQHTIGRPKGLLNTVPMMHVDINVHDSGVMAQKLQDAQNDVVDVAESASFGLFRMV